MGKQRADVSILIGLLTAAYILGGIVVFIYLNLDGANYNDGDGSKVAINTMIQATLLPKLTTQDLKLNKNATDFHFNKVLIINPQSHAPHSTVQTFEVILQGYYTSHSNVESSAQANFTKRTDFEFPILVTVNISNPAVPTLETWKVSHSFRHS